MPRRAPLATLLLAATLFGGCKPHATEPSAPFDASPPLAVDGGSRPLATTDGGVPPGVSEETNLPASASDDLTARARHLFEAIAHDNADLGVDMLFPREAYLAARDATDPGKAWDSHVLGAFRRAVHSLHRRTPRLEGAQFVSFELGHAVSQVVPRKREWKRALWRVERSKLSFTLDGAPGVLEVLELTSWRGNWYVTRLR